MLKEGPFNRFGCRAVAQKAMRLSNVQRAGRFLTEQLRSSSRMAMQGAYVDAADVAKPKA